MDCGGSRTITDIGSPAIQESVFIKRHAVREGFYSPIKTRGALLQTRGSKNQEGIKTSTAKPGEEQAGWRVDAVCRVAGATWHSSAGCCFCLLETNLFTPARPPRTRPLVCVRLKTLQADHFSAGAPLRPKKDGLPRIVRLRNGAVLECANR